MRRDRDSDGPGRTAWASVAAAGLLVVLKLGTGLVTGSLGLISAGIESSGDIVAALLTVSAIRLAGRPADEDHPYGHRRAENLAALGEAAVLAGGGIVVVVQAVGALTGGGDPVHARWYVFAVIAVVLVVDVSRVLVSVRSARAYGSAALRSNAFHFAGDFAGTLAVLIGLLAVRGGFEQGDAIAALVVAVIIFAAATRLVYENARVLMDTAPSSAQAEARKAIDDLDHVELRRLRLRESGGRFFADAVVGVPPGQAIVEGHSLADRVEAAVQAALPGSDVVVHLEPQREGLDLRQRVLAVALAEPLVREAHDIAIYEREGRASISLHLKLPSDLPLDEAHDIAERVETALTAEPGIDNVQTHLEPLEAPLEAEPEATNAQRDAAERERIAELVRGRLGVDPADLRLVRTTDGLVVLLSVGVDARTSLHEAHEIAGRLENDVRRGRTYLADVVVHVEPAGPTGR